MANFLKQLWAWGRYDLRYRFSRDPESGEPMIPSMAVRLVEPYADPPPAQCHALIVFGEGEVSPNVGFETARMIANGALRDGGTIFCTGGIRPAWKDKKNGLGLLAQQKKADGRLVMPRARTPEAESTAENIFAALPRFGSDPEYYDIRVKAGGRHAQGNIQDAQDSGLLDFERLGVKPGEDMVLGVVSTPQVTMRDMGTIRGMLRDQKRETESARITLRPMPAWPGKIGIDKTTYLADWRARAFVMGEAELILLPDPRRAKYASYMAEDFASAASQTRETVKLFDALKKQNPVAARQWLLRQQASASPRKDLDAFAL
jgi:hypothetical protein